MPTLPRLRERLLGAGLAPRTADSYYRTIRACEWWFDTRGWSLKRATAIQIGVYADTLPNSNASRNILRASLRWYWMFTGRKNPPLAAIRIPTRQRLVCRALEPTDAIVLAGKARARGDDKGLAVMIVLYSALRRSEVAALRWDAFADGWVTVVGKGNKTASLPLHPELVAVLAAAPRRDAYLFPGRKGGHVVAATIWSWFRQVAEEAGLGPVAPHVGRHTALATANDATGDLRGTMEFARHSRPETTIHYTRTTAAKLRAVVESLDY